MPATQTPCPGPCGRAWRRAETTGLPHELQPAWGQPVHCHGCQHRTRQRLHALPELLINIHFEATHGTARPADVTTMRPADIAPWPGQASRLLTDLIVGGLTELEDDVRDLRGLQARPTAVREGTTVTETITFLGTHLSWLLTEHPCAAEIHERGSGNPASQIAAWHRAAERFTRRDARREQRIAPCRQCGRRSLFFADGEDYIECENSKCGTLMTETEYAEWAREVAAESDLSAPSCKIPMGAPILGRDGACPEMPVAA